MSNSWKSVRQVLMSYFVCFLFDVFELRRVKNEDVGDLARDLTSATPCILNEGRLEGERGKLSPRPPSLNLADSSSVKTSQDIMLFTAKKGEHSKLLRSRCFGENQRNQRLFDHKKKA